MPELESMEVAARKLTSGKLTRSVLHTQCMHALKVCSSDALAQIAVTMVQTDSRVCVTRMGATCSLTAWATRTFLALVLTSRLTARSQSPSRPNSSLQMALTM